MRHSVAAIAMALGVSVAGNALAADATRVIYDLSSLRASPLVASAPRAPHEVQVPSTSLPIASPSLGERGPWGDAWGVGDEIARRSHGTSTGTAAGSPRGGRGRQTGQSEPGQDQSRDPSPTPEPGSMLLLGGALASGIRFMRRR